MSDERRGIVSFQYEGRTIPLRFTWRAVDRIGRVGVTELLEKAGSGQAGDMGALAKLLEAASDGRLTTVELMDSDLPFNDAFVPILQAWAMAARRPVNSSANPRMLRRLTTSLRTLWRRLFRLA